MNKLILILLLCLAGCQSDRGTRPPEDCNVEKEISDHFSNWIAIITMNYSNSHVEFRDLAKSYNVLEKVTGFKSLAVFGNDTFVIYESTDDYLRDIDRWLSWYSSHRCNIEMQDVLSIMSDVKVDFRNYQSEEFLNSYSQLYPGFTLLDAIKSDSLDAIDFAQGLPRLYKKQEDR